MSDGDQLKALLERRCASLNGEMRSIEKILSELMQAPERCPQLLKEIISVVHTVNGSSGSLGFLALSNAAKKLEDSLNNIARTGKPPRESDVCQARRLFSNLQIVAQRTTPEDSHLFGVDLSEFGPTAR